MKNVQLLFFALLFGLIPTSLSANVYYGCEADAISNGANTILTNEKNGTIKFIKLEEPVFMHQHKMEEWLKELLEANAKTGFRLYETKKDKLGYVHYRFRQTYDGYDVKSGVYYIHTLNGQVVSANGEFYPNINLDVNPVITPQGAIEIGKEHIHSHHWAWPKDRFPTPEIFVQQVDETYHLTYKTDIYSVDPIDRKFLMIDVLSGEVVAEYNRIHTNSVPGEAHCKYHGTQTIIVDSVGPNEFRLRDDTRGGGIETYDMNEGTDYGSSVDFTDTDNVWTSTTNDDDAALDAHWGAEGFYDYLLNTHGHDSFDGNGSTIRSYIHYGSNFVNAFWDGQRMTYGDGDGSSYSPLTSVDVVGHEIMHGVTEFTAGLIYAGESGGLNESYSDVFGVVLDYQLNPLTANFLMGDEFTATPFRDMGNPNDYSNPDTYGGLYWGNSGVHSWSGIQNFFFYLVTQGGSGTNDNSDDYDVTAIAMQDAADVLWRSLTVYLTENATMADARFFGIQSSEELFGDCSQQEISVTNGWYAVGIGEPFVEGVVADFTTSGNYNCQVPATVQFTNTSVNAMTYFWDFGNGTTSTDENPTVVFNQAGDYTVTLTATSSAGGLCSGTNTIVLTDLITVSSSGGPITPSCLPATNFATVFTGVFDFNFATINNPTNGSQEGYQDYTCTYAAVVTEALFYPFSATTGTTEVIRIWIDSDGNGIFDETNELVYVSPSPSASHQGEIFIPTPTNYNTPLRVRIKSDVSSQDLTDPCSNAQNGQVEDYTISISQNMMPPATDFVASQTLAVVNSTIYFTDLTQNIPNNWSWSFPGGTPSTSSESNPGIEYTNPGTYSVTLVATNSFGQATESKTGYITVVEDAVNCAVSFSNAESGTYYDSGGSNENYGDSEICDLLVAPDGCVKEVIMDFSSFNLETSDVLRIYDGEDFNAPLIGTYSGNNNPGTVVAPSGQMFLRFNSDFSLNNVGWEATWSSLVANGPPVANFSLSSLSIPVNGSVDCTDLSTEYPSEWSWSFGDGGTSTDMNPSHVYTTPGMYTITLTVTNCFSSDTYTTIVEVQEAPAVNVDPSSINLTLECGESSTVDITVSNTGSGDLIFDFDGGQSLAKMKERLNANFSSLTNLLPNFHPITDGETGTFIADGGGDMYDGGNRLSIDGSGELEYSNDVIIPNANLGTGGQYFTRKFPGLFVFAADINNADMFSINGTLGSDGNGNVDGAQLNVTHEGANYKGYVKRVWDAFADPSVNHLIIVKNSSTLNQTIPTTTNNDDHDISGLAGSSRIYYLLFAEADAGYYTNAQIEALMVQFLEIAELTSMDITAPAGPHTITGGNSETYPVTFFADGINTGVFTTNLTILSNDPSLTNLEIPVTVTVTGMSADFQVSGGPSSGIPFNFQSNSPTATSWLWEFGDGATSNQENPSHTYQVGNSYTVTLTVFNDAGCSAVVTTELSVLTDVEELESEIALYPNPSDGNIYIKHTSDETYSEIRVVNSIGQVVKLIDTSANTSEVYHLLLENFAPGMYILELKFADNQILQRKFVLQTNK